MEWYPRRPSASALRRAPDRLDGRKDLGAPTSDSGLPRRKGRAWVLMVAVHWPACLALRQLAAWAPGLYWRTQSRFPWLAAVETKEPEPLAGLLDQLSYPRRRIGLQLYLEFICYGVSTLAVRAVRSDPGGDEQIWIVSGRRTSRL